MPISQDKCNRRRQRGGALLAVLWLVAALSVIALSVAATVRGEVERTTVHTEGTRAYFLAKGAIDRAALYIQWGRGVQQPDKPVPYYRPGVRTLALSFPTGVAEVDVIPEAAKLNVNRVRVEDLVRLFLAMGLGPYDAEGLARAIDHWRNPVAQLNDPLDQYYLTLTPSFPARHASMDNVEDLLLVKGMTPELFYGTYMPGSGDSLVWRSGVRDCLTVYGRSDVIDINWADPAVLAAAGLPQQIIEAILARRAVRPFATDQEVAELGIGAINSNFRLGVGGRSIFTLRAAARLRRQDGGISDVQRTIAAVVDLNAATEDRPFTTLRWYDNAWKH